MMEVFIIFLVLWVVRVAMTAIAIHVEDNRTTIGADEYGRGGKKMRIISGWKDMICFLPFGWIPMLNRYFKAIK